MNDFKLTMPDLYHYVKGLFFRFMKNTNVYLYTNYLGLKIDLDIMKMILHAKCSPPGQVDLLGQLEPEHTYTDMPTRMKTLPIRLVNMGCCQWLNLSGTYTGQNYLHFLVSPKGWRLRLQNIHHS